MNVEAMPLAENEHVKELLALLEDNGKPTSGIESLLSHVKEMEDFIVTAESRISDMKIQLDTMREIGNPEPSPQKRLAERGQGA